MPTWILPHIFSIVRKLIKTQASDLSFESLSADEYFYDCDNKRYRYQPSKKGKNEKGYILYPRAKNSQN